MISPLLFIIVIKKRNIVIPKIGLLLQSNRISCLQKSNTVFGLMGMDGRGWKGTEISAFIVFGWEREFYREGNHFPPTISFLYKIFLLRFGGDRREREIVAQDVQPQRQRYPLLFLRTGLSLTPCGIKPLSSNGSDVSPASLSCYTKFVSLSTAPMLLFVHARQWGYVVLTTPNGVLDHEEAIKQNVGGQVLGYFH